MKWRNISNVICKVILAPLRWLLGLDTNSTLRSSVQDFARRFIGRILVEIAIIEQRANDRYVTIIRTVVRTVGFTQ